jgi:hypothetical protein
MFERDIPRSKRAISSREDLFDALADLRGYGKVDPLSIYIGSRGIDPRLEKELREQSGLED